MEQCIPITYKRAEYINFWLPCSFLAFVCSAWFFFPTQLHKLPACLICLLYVCEAGIVMQSVTVVPTYTCCIVTNCPSHCNQIVL